MKKKLLIIGIILITLIVIIAAGVVGYFIYKNKTKTGTEWGDIFLKELYRESSEHEYISATGNPDGTIDEKRINVDYYKNATNVNIQFIKVNKESDPLMLVSYKDNDVDTFSLYYTSEGYSSATGEKVKFASLYYKPEKVKKNSEGELEVIETKENKDVVLLYNIELGEYRWYIHTIYENGDEYFEDLLHDTNLNKEAENDNIEDKNLYYRFTADEMKINQKGEDGIDVVSKFEETFIVPEDIVDNKIEIGDIHNIEENKLKDYVKEEVTKFEEHSEVVTEEMKNVAQEKVTQLEEKKEQIKVAKEEKAKKEAEEKAKAEAEAARKAAEEAAKGLKIGKYTIKYGTYKGEKNGPAEGMSITINPDKTFKMIRYDGKVVTGTFKIETCNFSQDITPDYIQAMQFYKSNGEKYCAYTAWSNTVIGDNDIESFKYTGK